MVRDGWHRHTIKEIKAMRNIKRPAGEKGEGCDRKNKDDRLEIMTHDIPDYITPEVIECASFYMRYRIYGAPVSGGWYQWPATHFDVIEILDSLEGFKRNGS